MPRSSERMHEVRSGFSRHKQPRDTSQVWSYLLVFSRPQSRFSFSRVPVYLASTRLRALGALSKVSSGFLRFEQSRGTLLCSAVPSSAFEVPCLVLPRLRFCLLPGLAPLGVMSEVCSGSSRPKQPRGTSLGSASPGLLFYKRAPGFPPLGVVSDFFVRTFPPVFLFQVIAWIGPGLGQGSLRQANLLPFQVFPF